MVGSKVNFSPFSPLLEDRFETSLIEVTEEQNPFLGDVRLLAHQTITLDNNIVSRYYLSMIKSFRSKETEKLFLRHRSPRFSTDLHRIALRKLLLLDAL